MTTKIIKLALLGSILLFSKTLYASTYNFTLGGWSDGGILTGQFETSFSAELDTYISTPEIISFEATYTGLYNFNWTLEDVGYFGYSSPSDLTFSLGATFVEGNAHIGSPSSFTLNRYVAYFNGSEFSYTNEYMNIQEVTAVPLPPSILLLLSGLIGLGGISFSKSTPNNTFKRDAKQHAPLN